ncbi:MAG TPA: hypothetical protein VIH85_00620 [Solirubrobacteraceae bacterium]|jgi:hypothetical protein
MSTYAWREPLILDGTHFAAGTRLLEVGRGVGAVLAEVQSSFASSAAGYAAEERATPRRQM